jgi:hypothetical protein
MGGDLAIENRGEAEVEPRNWAFVLLIYIVGLNGLPRRSRPSTVLDPILEKLCLCAETKDIMICLSALF